MGDQIDPAEKATPYRWRPAVSPFRPRGIPGVRARDSLPGQLTLPGMECGDEPPPGGRSGDAPAAPADSLPSSRGTQADRPIPAPACPNCGSTEFDEDGDCTRCWEPGVVRANKRPQAREG